jgi:plasmid stabilization system protein ParE
VPRVIVTAGASRGLERCREFLTERNRAAAARAGQTIERRFGLLETYPEIGRPFPESAGLRELVIAFGDSGYVALYRYDVADDEVHILAFRHQKEAGY